MWKLYANNANFRLQLQVKKPFSNRGLTIMQAKYCKFGNVCKGFMKIKPLPKGEISLSFTDIGKSCSSRAFLTSQICL